MRRTARQLASGLTVVFATAALVVAPAPSAHAWPRDCDTWLDVIKAWSICEQGTGQHRVIQRVYNSATGKYVKSVYGPWRGIGKYSIDKRYWLDGHYVPRADIEVIGP